MGAQPKAFYSVTALALVVFLTSFSFGAKRFTYKMTTEIVIDGVKFSGSAVRQIFISENYGPMAGAPYRARTHGEAVVVDMGRLGKAFTLLNRVEPDEGVTYGNGCTGDAVANYIVARMKNSTDCSDSIEYINRFKNVKRTLEFFGPTVPTTIRFNDISNPKTVNYLNKDYKLRYFLSASDEIPTRRIFSDIPWLSHFFGKRLDDGPLEKVGTLPSLIEGSEFSSEPPSG
ncbi:hypothetical protein [Sphingobium sp. Sx8-8]|uniref:hypothetical protein n=1 Tax=Sphingobium sp. Sx8-8 TaxID=2933617 RepID=UPI001F598ED1|nr:hypothetical protein [Sphingobium sp. Sx8-8]